MLAQPNMTPEEIAAWEEHAAKGKLFLETKGSRVRDKVATYGSTFVTHEQVLELMELVDAESFRIYEILRQLGCCYGFAPSPHRVNSRHIKGCKGHASADE